MLDLAPHNPYGLSITTSLLARAGLGGAGIEKYLNMPHIGAIISDPLTLKTQRATRFMSIPSGILYPPTGRSLAQNQRRIDQWSNASKPVIPALQPRTLAEMRQLLAMIDNEATPALVLDVSEWREEQIDLVVRYVREHWERPLFVEVALDQPIQPWLERNNDQFDGIILAYGQRGAIKHQQTMLTGRMRGACIEPSLLYLFQHFKALIDTRWIIGATTLEFARTLHELGATAIIGDVGLWTQPEQWF